jgi:hypothetical protein
MPGRKGVPNIADEHLRSWLAKAKRAQLRFIICAEVAIAEAVRLDEQERPAREIQHAKDISLAKEKLRPVNKTNFRP